MLRFLRKLSRKILVTLICVFLAIPNIFLTMFIYEFTFKFLIREQFPSSIAIGAYYYTYICLIACFILSFVLEYIWDYWNIQSTKMYMLIMTISVPLFASGLLPFHSIFLIFSIILCLAFSFIDRKIYKASDYRW